MNIRTLMQCIASQLDLLWQKLANSFFSKFILLPFLITRLIWLVIAFFSVNYQANPTYAEYAQRGWFLYPRFLMDLWLRWDAKWYLSIIEHGYSTPADFTSQFSNIAFFPLFPYLVKSIGWILPEAWVSRGLYLLVGLIISNAAFLGAAFLLYRLVLRYFADELVAKRTLQLYFIFPTSFYFSAFYTESLFLLLVVACFLSALDRRWWLSGVLCGLLALTRPQGIAVVTPLLLLYLESIHWRIKKLRTNILALSLPFITFAAHLYTLYAITGNVFAPFLVQKSWGRFAVGYLEVIWTQIRAPVLDVFKLDFFFLLLFFVTGVLLLCKYSPRAFGAYVLLMILMPIATGSVVSGSRLVLAVFPVFIFWAKKLNRKGVFDTVLAFLFAFQILYFLGWMNYYWIA